MNFVLIFFAFFAFPSTFVVLGQRTFLDSPMNVRLYRAVKDIAFQVVGKTGDSNHEKGIFQRIIQERIPDDVPFRCNLTDGVVGLIFPKIVDGIAGQKTAGVYFTPASRSPTVPTSVHKLRPGDIDVIGCMGDSLTAGSGIFARNVVEMIIENRGVTALGGGQGTWRDYYTIPNIIKAFNPNLIGYSPYDSLTHGGESGFNVAEIAAMSRDLPYMSENLINRIKKHPGVDLNKSWKLISILIGPNDFCSDMCWRRSGASSILKAHENDLIKSLRILKEKLPRTLVSLIPPPNVKLLTDLKVKTRLCAIAKEVACSCFTGLRWQSRKTEYSEVVSAWQRMDEEIANMPEFQTDEFAVVIQPFATKLTFPMKPNGTPEWRYLATDCFHLSQIGNARAARAIWKNMLEPVGQKSCDWDDNETLVCPTESRPYISTLVNSQEGFKA